MANLSKLILPVKNTTTGVVTNQEFNLPSGGGSSAEVKTATLAASATSVTFTSLPTTGDHMIDFFTSDGSNYTAIDTSTSGQVTLTFEASSSARTVYCRIEEVS